MASPPFPETPRSRGLASAAGVLVVALGLALATSEPWLVLLGAAAAGALWLLSEHPVWELLLTLDAAHRDRALRLFHLRDQILAELAGSPLGARQLLSVTTVRVRELASGCPELVRQHQQLERFLHRIDSAEARRERTRLETLAGSEADPVAKQRYREAAAAKNAGLLASDELARNLARLDGELETIQATLEKLLAQAVRMNSAQPRSAGELGDLTLEVDTLVHSLEEVIDPSRRKENP